MGILARAGRRAVFAFDALLRRRFGIVEYSSDPGCILRAAIVPARADLTLRDGTTVVRGQPIADLHLWSDRLPPMPPHGADLAWIAALDARLHHSLALLAAHLRHPQRAAVHAVRLETFFGRPDADMARLGRRFGFELVRSGAARTLGGQLHRFFAGFLFLALTWAFSPATLRGKRFRRQHDEFWMSRAALDARYGDWRASARRNDS